MFRWDLWIQGALSSGVIALVAAAPAIVIDGVTGPELWALLAGFLGGLALYCKAHPPEPWKGEERRDNNKVGP